MKTKSIQMTRGQTYSFTETVRDENNARVDLTGAKVYFAMRANQKISPSIKLTSDVDSPSAEWRVGVVIATQTGSTIGNYTVTLIPADTSGLVALGHDDPWFYETLVEKSDGTVFPHIYNSRLDLYPQVTDLPT